MIEFMIFESLGALNEFLASEKPGCIIPVGFQYHAASKSHAMWFTINKVK